MDKQMCTLEIESFGYTMSGTVAKLDRKKPGSKKQIIIKRDLYKLEVSFAPNIIMDKKLMSDNWDKYLKDLKKLISSSSE